MNKQRLPIHLCCSRGASTEVIEAVLEDDESKRSVMVKSGIGRTALLIAIENKLSADSIKLLLQAESSTIDILSPFRGQLPIHVACWKNYNVEVVKLLLEKDSYGTQLQTTTTKPLSHYLAINNINDDEDDDKLIVMSPSNSRASHRSHLRDIYNGMRPISLALSRGATDICELLLQEEDLKGMKHFVNCLSFLSFFL